MQDYEKSYMIIFYRFLTQFISVCDIIMQCEYSEKIMRMNKIYGVHEYFINKIKNREDKL